MSEPTEKEAKFLADLKATFESKHDKKGNIETNKKGEVKIEAMSGLEVRILNKLTEKMSAPGELGQEAIGKIVADEIDAAVNDAHRGNKKVGDLIEVSGLNKGVGILKKAVGDIVPGSGRAVRILENGVETAISSKISEKQEESIRSEVSVAEVLDIAKADGLPEKSEKANTKPGQKTPATTTAKNSPEERLGALIKQAAQEDKDPDLSKSELSKLVNSDAFKKIANEIAPGAKISATNKPGGVDDAIVIENDDTKKTIKLQKADPAMRFGDDVVTGPLATSGGGKPAPASKGR
jgi:hypothetical protein